MTVASEKIAETGQPLTKEKIVERYRYLVVSIAEGVRNKFIKTLPMEDLIQSGMIGLLEAANRFDPTRKVDFATYSYYRIKGAMYDSLREMGFLPPSERKARIDANLNEASMAVNDTAKAASGKIDDEIAGLEKSVSTLIASYFLTVSLEEAPEIKISSTQNDFVEKKEIFSILKKAVEELPKMESELIKGIYFQQMTAVQVCKKLNIGKSWGSKLHAGGINRLKKKLIQAGIFCNV